MTPDPVLQVRNLGVTLGGRRILDGVNFEIRRGEFTGLIGSNGVGKTTLLRAVLGLQPLHTGEVLLNGSTGRDAHALGYVPQQVLLDPDVPLRARDFVALGLDGHHYGLRRRNPDARVRVEEILRDVDAVSFADARVGELSGGEQQRVLIAHALVGRPSLLLLDEPLANLDPKSVQDIVRLLRDVATRHDVAVLLSAHEMNALLPVMDRVVYINAGRVASGPTDEVVRSEVLSELYGHHVDVVTLHGRVFIVADPPHDDVDVAQHPTITWP